MPSQAEQTAQSTDISNDNATVGSNGAYSEPDGAYSESTREATIRSLYAQAAALAGAGDLDAARRLHDLAGELLGGLGPDDGANVVSLPKRWRR